MPDHILSLLVAIVAPVVADRIIKWLDNRKR